MNMNILQAVTPIKLEPRCIDSGHNTSYSPDISECSYFNMAQLEQHDLNDASSTEEHNLSPMTTSTPCHKIPQTPASSNNISRKALFFQKPHAGSTVEEAQNTTINNLVGELSLIYEESPGEFKNLNNYPSKMENDNNNEDFSIIWKHHIEPVNGVSQPPFPYTDESVESQDNIAVDVLSAYQNYAPGGDNRGMPIPLHSDAISQPSESSGYPCNAYQTTNNGIMRSYSDMTHQLNPQTTLSNLSNNHQMSVHQLQQYQSTSPNAGDGSSTHNSPFAPSPSQGFDYPTSPPVKPSIPSNTDYAGDYNFQINFGEATDSAPKSAQYTYSHALNKLFVKMNVTCPVRFKCDQAPPMNSIIRAMPVFKRPEHVTDLVTRCPNHRIPDEAHPTYMHRSGHLIRAEMPDDRHVRYDVAPDTRESVSVLYERPQIGAEYTTVLYKFMCLSSCVGGINRRPLLTVFQLENSEGQILGRRVVEIRICSCPGRDRSQEEKRKMAEINTSQANAQDRNGKRAFKSIQGSMEIIQTVPVKKKRATPNSADNEEFILKIRGREKFMMLKRVKEALDLMEYVTPQQHEAYRNKEEQEQAAIRTSKLQASNLSLPFPKKPTTSSY